MAGNTGTQDQIAQIAGTYSIGGVALSLNTYSTQMTTDGTFTPTAATCYVSSIAIAVVTAGVSSSLTIQDKNATPLKLVNALVSTTASTLPTIISYPSPLKMVGGIDIITLGTTASTNNVWITYYQ